MKIFAGIDGGQSSSSAVLGDESGAVLVRVTGPPADLVGEARDSRRQAGVLEALLADALARVGLARDTRFASLVASISGYDEGESVPPRLAVEADSLRFVHDTVAAHAGAFDGGPGIVVVAGTGSVAYGVAADGTKLRVGGWGYLFGDEGSAFWLGRRAIRDAMRAEDAGELDGRRAQAVLTALGLPTLRAVQHAFAHGELTRPKVAALGPLVLEDARMRERAAQRLAGLAALAAQRLGGRRWTVAGAGGLFAASAPLRRAFARKVEALLPKASVVPPRYDPVLGALRLAYDEAGVEPGLRDSAP